MYRVTGIGIAGWAWNTCLRTPDPQDPRSGARLVLPGKWAVPRLPGTQTAALHGCVFLAESQGGCGTRALLWESSESGARDRPRH